MSPIIEDALIGLGLLALLLVALEVGLQTGRRVKGERSGLSSGQIGAIQGAILGLLGLLLAFSFAAAGGRFLERQDLIVIEANAIGTSTLRADLLNEPYRTNLRNSLRDYTNHRLALSARLRYGLSTADAAEVDRMHAQVWSAAMAGVKDQPQTMIGVLPPINDVIDLHATRVAAGRKHVPKLVMGLLIACSALAMGVIGYGCGIGGHRRAPLTGSLALLIAAALWITYDLDHPRIGMMTLSDEPLKALRFD